MSVPYAELLKYRNKLPPIQKFPIFKSENPLILSEISPNGKVLDFGCGRGRIYNEVLMSEGFDGIYVGIDIDPSLITNFPLYTNIEKFELEHNYRDFDILLMLNIIEHLSVEETYNTIKKLNPYIDEKIIIITPNPQCFDYMFGDPEHKTFYPYYYLQAMLEHFDFPKVQIWRGQGLHVMREDEGKRKPQIKQMMTEMNEFQRKVCVAMGLDWCGNLLVIGTRNED